MSTRLQLLLEDVTLDGILWEVADKMSCFESDEGTKATSSVVISLVGVLRYFSTVLITFLCDLVMLY